MFGHFASWQTVWSLLSFTASIVSLKVCCCFPDGSRVRNQFGKRGLGALGDAIFRFLAITSHPRCTGHMNEHQKGVQGRNSVFLQYEH